MTNQRGPLRHLTNPPIASHEIGRARFRAALSLATVALILATLPFLPHHRWASTRTLAVFVAAGLTMGATTGMRRLHWFWDRLGGIAGIGIVTMLATFTGGARSPYVVLYLINLLYGAIFHDRRRLIAESLLLLACVGVLMILSDDLSSQAAVLVVVRLGVLYIMAAVVHGLVTQLRRITGRLEASEQQYRSLVEYNPDAVHTFTLDGRFASANPAAALMSGYSPDELRAMRNLPLSALLAPDKVAETQEHFKATAQGRPQHFETAILDRQGSRVELQVASVPIIVDGEVVGIYSVSKDITDRKRAERLLRERAAQQAAVGRLGQSALAIADLRVLMEEATGLVAETLHTPLAAVFELAGQDEAVLVAGVGWRAGAVGAEVVPVTPGQDLAAVVAAERPVAVADYLMEDERLPAALLERHGVISGMGASIRAADRIFGVIAVYAREPREFGDEERGFLQTIADVLAGAIGRRRAEQQLLQAQKLQAVGQLAGGIAHDFNNLLTALLGYCELLEPFVAGSPVAREHLREALGAGARARALVDQILTFSLGRVSSLAVGDVNAIVRGMEGLLRRLVADAVDVRTELALDLGAVAVDGTQLEQVVLNLALNARDAMPGGGVLTIATAETDMGGPEAERLGLAPGPYVSLRVRDTGVGIDAATRTRLFEPFFTTKDPDKGTGLGLSTVYGIATAAGGQVLVDSQPGRGTTFTVYLPRVAAQASESLPGQPGSTPAPSPPGTILVVEDQAAVRSLVCEILGQRGHAVLQAANGVEAVSIAAEHAGPIDLLVTDVVMPQVGGPELAERLRADWPTLRVLYMSGYSAHPELVAGQDPDADFLAKPFGVEDLLDKIAGLLARPRPAAAGGGLPA